MKKGLIIAAAMILAVCLGVGGTLAYLFVKTETVTNTFSPSHIELKLEETTGKDYHMIPGVEMGKDPKVTAFSDVACYVFVKVEKKNNPDLYLEYTIDSFWKELDAINYPGVYYKELAAGQVINEWPILVDDKVTTRASVTKDQLAGLYEDVGVPDEDKCPQLIFTAYAIQKDGFADAKTAWPYALAQQNP